MTSPLRKLLILLFTLAVPISLAAQEHANTPVHRHYKLIDMGTLGGPASYFTEPGFGRGELVLNSQGEVAGKADTSTPDNRSGNCPPICFDTKVFRWQRGGPHASRRTLDSHRQQRCRIHQCTRLDFREFRNGRNRSADWRADRPCCPLEGR